jgi:predicted nucleic acid-binding protein
MKRIVLDTNIIVSSALSGALELILDKWAEDVFPAIVTSDIIAEYFEVINRPKFRLNQTTIDRIIRYRYQFADGALATERARVSAGGGYSHLECHHK